MPSAVPSRLTSSMRAESLRVDVDEQAGDLDAGVVDQDVEPAEVADGGRDRGVLPARLVGHVEVDEAVRPSPLSESATFAPSVVLQVGDDDRRAGGGERLGHAFAESLGGAGDEGGASGQVEIGHG